MTAINTIEDLIRLLDEKPEWVEALRDRLLTRELIELPEKFAKFAAATTERLDGMDARIDQFRAEVDARFGQVDQRFDQMDARFGQVDQRFGQVDQRFDQVDQRFDQMDARFGQMDARFGQVDVRSDEIIADMNARFNRIEVILGPLRGAHARDAAIRKANIIARRAGLRRVRNLSQDDLQDLADGGDTSQLPANELDSFLEADLVIEAVDSPGETAFIAVEISFTVNGRDTDSAIRNARLLRSLTRRDAYAFVAGVHKDDRVQDIIDAGDVAWFELEPRDLEAD